jgi:hypothetical protein
MSEILVGTTNFNKNTDMPIRLLLMTFGEPVIPVWWTPETRHSCLILPAISYEFTPIPRPYVQETEGPPENEGNPVSIPSPAWAGSTPPSPTISRPPFHPALPIRRRGDRLALTSHGDLA